MLTTIIYITHVMDKLICSIFVCGQLSTVQPRQGEVSVQLRPVSTESQHCPAAVCHGPSHHGPEGYSAKPQDTAGAQVGHQKVRTNQRQSRGDHFSAGEKIWLFPSRVSFNRRV